MATYTKTVDPNGGSNYASLSAWEAGEQTLYVSGDIAVADCRQTGATKDTVVTLAGWTSGVKAQITGNPTYGFYYLWDTTAVSSGISIGAGGPDTTLELLDIKKTAGSGSSVYGIGHTGTNGIPLTVKRCAIHHCRASGIQASTSSVFRIENCFVYANGGTGISSIFGAGAPTSVAIDNCTFIGNTGNGINRTSGTVNARNCYSGGNSSADYTGTITKTTCASSDATGTSGLQSIAYTTANFANVTAGSEDFHLVAGSALIGVGTDLSGTFTTDIDGTTRSAPWDIGADQYVAAGGTTYIEPLTTLADAYATVTDIQTYIEAAQALITANISVADTVTMLESILFTAQAADSVSDLAQRADSLLAVIQAADSVQSTQAMVDSLVADITALPSVADTLTAAGVENLQTTITAADSVQDLVAILEQVSTAITAVATVVDEQISAAAENLLTTATAITSVTDLQLMVDNLTIIAQSTASISEIFAYLEKLASAAISADSVADVIHTGLIFLMRGAVLPVRIRGGVLPTRVRGFTA